jgi:hypothetical protein
MTTSRVITAVAALAVWIAAPAPADAHRLDEYLQATRLSIDNGRIGVEIDLTAGESIASEVFAGIDTNHDGRISSDEGNAYARTMLRAVMLSVDGQPAPVTLIESRFPEFDAMSLGVGVIRLRATATSPSTATGHHSVSYTNTHRPDLSVYLVNALLPDDERIQIGRQLRDRAQHGLTFDYDVTTSAAQIRTYWLLTAVATLAFLGAARGLRSKRQRRDGGGDAIDQDNGAGLQEVALEIGERDRTVQRF